jgi:hypothetical protein
MKYKFLALALVIGLAGCSDFLDINEDPNNPTHAQLNTILPYSQATIFGALGIGTAGISELLSVYVHQTVQRGTHDDYKVPGNEFSLTETWDKLYTVALPDLNQMIEQGAEEGRPAYSGIAKIMKAQIFTLMVDIWGDVPYSEAGDPITFLFPHFDDDAAIYAEMFDLVRSGIADLESGGAPPATDDLIYGGNLDRWHAFANSLLLNMYNKVRLTNLYSQQQVDSLLTQPLITTAAGDFELDYNASITPENRHPGFIREYAQNDAQYFVSPYFYHLLKGEQACQSTLLAGIPDPRLPYYIYNQLSDGEAAQNPISYRDGNFLSIWFGSFDRDPNEGFDQNNSQSLVGLYPVGGAYDDGSGAIGTGNSGLRGASAQRILTSADVDFIVAELSLTTATTGDPATLLMSAMTKAFAKVNLIATAAGAPLIAADARDAYINAVITRFAEASDAEKLEIIMTQKWLAAYGFAIESYNDIRRTGYPQVCDPAQDLNEYSIQTNSYPVSLPYSQSDLTNNRNAPPQRIPSTDKVFWDID